MGQTQTAQNLVWVFSESEAVRLFAEYQEAEAEIRRLDQALTFAQTDTLQISQ